MTEKEKLIIPFDEIKNNKEINTYITQANASLSAMGFTEHSFGHVTICVNVVKDLLTKLGYSKREINLGQIAAYMHDIGNVVNRNDHAQTGAVMAFRILDNLGMMVEDIATIVTAIGNHDDSTAYPVNAITAALILADKTDVRRSRVTNKDRTTFDIHDRVNFAAVQNSVNLDTEAKTFTLKIVIDTEICSVMDYFEIFLERMILCKKAAKKLGLEFRLIINDLSVI